MTPEQEAKALDRRDPLAHCRDWFELPADTLYLDGNSLGALPKSVRTAVAKTVDREWGDELIRSWNSNDWINLPRTVGEKIAPLIGAGPGQVICCDSTSINIFKLLITALRVNSPRKEILSSQENFPTDLYMAEGAAEIMAGRLTRVAPHEIASAIGRDTAVLMLTHVNFRDGSLLDLEQITRIAHEKGVLVLWDLSHTTGVIPVELDRHDVDFAVGCGYKYLNGGPGAPAYLYVNRRLIEQADQPLKGWMGHANAFEFEPGYTPASGIERFLTGTPGILSMKALSSALDLLSAVNSHDIRTKSMQLTDFFIRLTGDLEGVTLLSPPDSAVRGSQVSLTHPAAYAVIQALIDRGVIGDFRAPDIMRFGFAPLYTSFADTAAAASALQDILETRSHEQARFSERKQVT